jgi:hypothetical protein
MNGQLQSGMRSTKEKRKKSDLGLDTFNYNHLKVNVRSGDKMSVEMVPG